MNNCNILYTISINSSGLKSEIISMLFPLFIQIMVALFLYMGRKSIYKKLGAIIFLLIGLYYDISFISVPIHNYFEAKNSYNNKNFKEVIGLIQKYEVEKIKYGYYVDSFEVKGIKFSFDNLTYTGGYKISKLEEGVLKNGLFVKLKYLPIQTGAIKNIILEIEKCPRE